MQQIVYKALIDILSALLQWIAAPLKLETVGHAALSAQPVHRVRQLPPTAPSVQHWMNQVYQSAPSVPKCTDNTSALYQVR